MKNKETIESLNKKILHQNEHISFLAREIMSIEDKIKFLNLHKLKPNDKITIQYGYSYFKATVVLNDKINKKLIVNLRWSIFEHELKEFDYTSYNLKHLL